jgi:hypothetical protein
MTTKTRVVVRRTPVAVEVIQRRIYLVRGQKVMIDADLAKLYQGRRKISIGRCNGMRGDSRGKTLSGERRDGETVAEGVAGGDG